MLLEWRWFVLLILGRGQGREAWLVDLLASDEGGLTLALPG